MQPYKIIGYVAYFLRAKLVAEECTEADDWVCTVLPLE